MSASTPVGIAIAAVGLSHFARPELFEAITKAAVDGDVRRHTFINGGIETLLGAGIAVPRTRKFALAGLVSYAGYLGFSVVRNRG